MGCKDETQGSRIDTKTLPIKQLDIAQKFITNLEDDFSDNGTVEWPKADSGKYIRSWYVESNYIKSINEELSKLKDVREMGIRLYPVKNDSSKFSIMVVGNYTTNEGKTYILKYKVNNGVQDPKSGIAPMYEWLDPCPNNCPNGDFTFSKLK